MISIWSFQYLYLLHRLILHNSQFVITFEERWRRWSLIKLLSEIFWNDFRILIFLRFFCAIIQILHFLILIFRFVILSCFLSNTCLTKKIKLLIFYVLNRCENFVKRSKCSNKSLTKSFLNDLWLTWSRVFA